MSEAPKPAVPLTEAEIERRFAEAEAESRMQQSREIKAQWKSHSQLRKAALERNIVLPNIFGIPEGHTAVAVPDMEAGIELPNIADLSGARLPAVVTPPKLLSALAAFPREVSDALVTLWGWHSLLSAGARTADDIRLAFMPLLVARSFFGPNGGLLPPSKIERAIRAEAKRGWRGHEFPQRLTGRPPGPWIEFVRQRIKELAQHVDTHPVNQQRFKNWILAKGERGKEREVGKPGIRGTASPGAKALVDYVVAGWRARGHSEAEIRRGKKCIMAALDNMRRTTRK